MLGSRIAAGNDIWSLCMAWHSEALCPVSMWRVCSAANNCAHRSHWWGNRHVLHLIATRITLGDVPSGLRTERYTVQRSKRDQDGYSAKVLAQQWAMWTQGLETAAWVDRMSWETWRCEGQPCCGRATGGTLAWTLVESWRDAHKWPKFYRRHCLPEWRKNLRDRGDMCWRMPHRSWAGEGENEKRRRRRLVGSSKSWILLLASAGIWSSVSPLIKRNYSQMPFLLLESWKVCVLKYLQVLPRSMPVCFVH